MREELPCLVKMRLFIVENVKSIPAAAMSGNFPDISEIHFDSLKRGERPLPRHYYLEERVGCLAVKDASPVSLLQDFRTEIESKPETQCVWGGVTMCVQSFRC